MLDRYGLNAQMTSDFVTETDRTLAKAFLLRKRFV